MAKRHKGPVAWSNEITPPGHFAVTDEGPDFSKRVTWLEAKPDDADDLDGHWEESPLSKEELEAAVDAAEQRLVNLKAVAKGAGKASG